MPRSSHPTKSSAGSPLEHVGGGEMGALIRALDWKRTPLGPPSAWPQSLRTAVGICLESAFPMNIWWGPELVQFYNDALSAHPRGPSTPLARAQTGSECWADIWPVVGPLYANVVKTRQGHLGGQPPARDGSVRIRGGDVLHLLLQPDPGRVGAGRRCPDHLHRDDGEGVIGERRLRVLRDLGAAIRSGPQWRRGLPSRRGEPRRASDRSSRSPRSICSRARGRSVCFTGRRASTRGRRLHGERIEATSPAPALAPGRGQSAPGAQPWRPGCGAGIPAFPEGPGRWPPIRPWCCRSRGRLEKANRRGS